MLYSGRDRLGLLRGSQGRRGGRGVGERLHELHGPVAFAAWLGVHAALMSGVCNRVQAFIDWGWDYVSDTRGPQPGLRVLKRRRIDWGEPDDNELAVTEEPAPVAPGVA